METWTVNELRHHGIKGMHWGIRRFQPYPKGHKGGKEIGEAAAAHDDYKRAHGLGEHKKDVRSMSDAELRIRLNRIQMEQQYSRLSGSDVNRGKKAADKVLKTATTIGTATTTAITIYNNAEKIGKIVQKLSGH